MSSCCSDEWRLVFVEVDDGAEVDGDARSLSCGSGKGNSLTGWLHTKLTLPRWLARSVEAAAASRQRNGAWPR
jgi:hypothetical protein